ncbi:MAG: sigma-70 family RNA polymerase sigma factor [Treponema sp.]|uniref:sigma-70 family RNA polymerase sigma factor n=1 Tax=Treponema sp. TaxID=166 RepID=UPI002A91BFD1|nr:sigma-70 family RNA polymerase sigma factor [Treponema sp.]MDY6397725.1 sigma-70 family RNA polymerase sigma factor [Treponema sp.]
MTKFHTTKILSAQEEIEYAKLAAAGDMAAREKLIVSNIPFVRSLAKSFRGYGVGTEDLVAEGILGLVEAVDRFDYSRGFKLITYAKSWIWMFMQKAVNQRGRKKFRLVSLDASFDSDGNEASFGSGLADTENLSVEEVCENNIATERLLKALFSLKANEREVLILHHGLFNEEEHSFEAIGAMKGRTRSRMQQIEKNAVEHLRENLERFVG